MKICFVVLDEMLTGVVPSQVLGPARAWAAAFPGVSVRVVFLEPARVACSRAARARLRELRAALPAGGGREDGAGVRIQLCPYVARLGDNAPALSLAALLWATLRPASGRTDSRPVRPSSGRRKPAGAEESGRLILHCRGPEATLQAVAAVGRRGRVVFDARGAAGPETQLRLAAAGGDAERVARSVLAAAARERQAADAADAVSAVSAPLLRRLTAHFDPDDARPLAVVPCCVEGTTFDPAARAGMRNRLGLQPGELLLVHTSTEVRWEDFSAVRALFQAVHARRQARLLLLTTLPEDEAVRGLGADPLRAALLVRRAAPGEVPAWLAAADAGLLLRRPHEALRVASPIKLAEYLAAGLPVAVTAGTGAAAELVEGRGIGVAVPGGGGQSSAGTPRDFDDAAGRLLALTAQGAAARERALAACRELFVWRRYAPEVARLYGLPAAEARPVPQREAAGDGEAGGMLEPAVAGRHPEGRRGGLP